MMKKKLKTLVKPTIIAIFAFIILIFASIGITDFKHEIRKKEITTKISDALSTKKLKLESAVKSHISTIQKVADYIALNPKISNEMFDILAQECLQKDTIIHSISLAKDCVVHAIYPRERNSSMLGLDLLKDSERKKIIDKAIGNQNTVIDIPITMEERDRDLIYYTPVFENGSRKPDRFWGLIRMTMKESSLINEAKLDTVENFIKFALCENNESLDQKAIFWGVKGVLEDNPKTILIKLPTEEWILAATPVKRWNQYSKQNELLLTTLIFISFTISLLIWFVTTTICRTRQRERELNAIFSSIDHLIIEFNQKGEYLKIIQTGNNLLIRPEREILGKSVFNFFDHGNAQKIVDAINECLRDKHLVIIDYPIELNSETRWFTGRIFFKSEDTVIFNAFDNTDKKKNEEIIRHSEKSLRELNMMKDKFFSIVAHDLRNPVNSQKMMIDMMIEDYENIDDTERKELLEMLQKSASGLSSLLENLLKWVQAQSGKLTVSPQDIELFKFCDTIISPLMATATLKNIKLSNEIAGNVVAFSDTDIAGTVLRNLVSNAIKFTPAGGTIRICSDKIVCGEQPFHKICVIDNGIGIDPVIMSRLFNLGQPHSTPGTNEERGNGLGLMLCDELTQKLGGKLSVDTRPEKGSTFSFTLPASAEIL